MIYPIVATLLYIIALIIIYVNTSKPTQENQSEFDSVVGEIFGIVDFLGRLILYFIVTFGYMAFWIFYIVVIL
jgi:hypothetical protein